MPRLIICLEAHPHAPDIPAPAPALLKQNGSTPKIARGCPLNRTGQKLGIRLHKFPRGARKGSSGRIFGHMLFFPPSGLPCIFPLKEKIRRLCLALIILPGGAAPCSGYSGSCSCTPEAERQHLPRTVCAGALHCAMPFPLLHVPSAARLPQDAHPFPRGE